jgi:hypothetical protein
MRQPREQRKIKKETDVALTDFPAWLEGRSFAMQISQSDWLFPFIETLHVVAIALVVGAISMLDLRLLGISRKDYGVQDLAAETLPWTWISFSVAIVTGALMFSSAATRYITLVPFWIKMMLLLAAGINMAIFHLTAYRSAGEWNHQLPPPNAARVAGTLSLCFWVSVVFMGRWIGFA